MTQREYSLAYKAARNSAVRITAQTVNEIKKAYIAAGDLAQAAVRDATERGLSDLTSSSWASIDRQLQAGANLISESTIDLTPKAVSKAYKNYGAIDSEYIADAVKASGNAIITKEGIEAIVVGIDQSLVAAMATRIYSDGYTFSERVWKTFDLSGKPTGMNGDYIYRIKNLILTGTAQARDAVDIAKDIQVYIDLGKDEVFKPGRYGRLVPGTGEFKKRISKTVDWRALRVVRSEMHASLQEAGVLEGVMNPASPDLYNWKKTPGDPIDPNGSKNASGERCIDLDRGSPYSGEVITSFGYQHSNCSCGIEPVLMDQREFVADLKDWTPGSGPEYLDEWFRTIYSAK